MATWKPTVASLNLAVANWKLRLASSILTLAAFRSAVAVLRTLSKNKKDPDCDRIVVPRGGWAEVARPETSGCGPTMKMRIGRCTRNICSVMVARLQRAEAMDD